MLPSSQILQQRLRLLQIARVETLRKPPVNRSQQFARLLHLALISPQPREADCRVNVGGAACLTAELQAAGVATGLNDRGI